MDAFAAIEPSCLPPPLADGPSRLSPAPGALPMPPPPPLLAENDVQAAPFSEDELQATLFSEEEFHAMMLQPLSFSEDDYLEPPPPLFSVDDALRHRALLSGENNAQLQGPLVCEDGEQLQARKFSVDDDGVHAPPSSDDDDDDDILAALRCGEDDIQDQVQETLAAHAQQPSPHSDGQRANETRPPPSGEDDDDKEEAEPAEAPRRRAMSVRKKSTKRRRQQQLRAWHRLIATCVLTRQFRGASELSGGRTALRCQCLELSRAEGPRGGGGGGGRCALHQDAPGRSWIRAVHGGIPLLCGPDEVLVPALSAGDSAEVVAQYARWRRGVWMPTRFYVQRAAEPKVLAFEQQDDDDDDYDDDWMMDV